MPKTRSFTRTNTPIHSTHQSYELLVNTIGLTNTHVLILDMLKAHVNIIFIPRLRNVIKQLSLPDKKRCVFMRAFKVIPASSLFLLTTIYGGYEFWLPSSKAIHGGYFLRDKESV